MALRVLTLAWKMRRPYLARVPCEATLLFGDYPSRVAVAACHRQHRQHGRRLHGLTGAGAGAGAGAGRVVGVHRAGAVAVGLEAYDKHSGGQRGVRIATNLHVPMGQPVTFTQVELHTRK